jgi:NADH-quinone oxidoreductase subunit M
MPRYAVIFLFFTMASVGLPGTSGFVGEVLIMVGAFQVDTWVAVLMATGVIFSAAYMLWLYRRVIFGELTKPDLKDLLDLNKRELVIFTPIVLVVLWMGVYPQSFLRIMHVSVDHLVTEHQASLDASGAAPPGAAPAEQPAESAE